MDIDHNFGHWLAGFIDGEGHFAIGRYDDRRCGSTGYNCRFVLAVRDDDRAVLEDIQHRVGTGCLRPHSAPRKVPNAKPTVVWGVETKGGCLELVELLDLYPLRSKKARDYAIWREAVLVWHAMPRHGFGPGRVAIRFDWTRMAELHDQIREGRRYQASAA